MQSCAWPGKVFDHMSKGIREAPGKALIGELAAASGGRPEGAFGAPCWPQSVPEYAVRHCSLATLHLRSRWLSSILSIKQVAEMCMILCAMKCS